MQRATTGRGTPSKQGLAGWTGGKLHRGPAPSIPSKRAKQLCHIVQRPEKVMSEQLSDPTARSDSVKGSRRQVPAVPSYHRQSRRGACEPDCEGPLEGGGQRQGRHRDKLPCRSVANEKHRALLIWSLSTVTSSVRDQKSNAERLCLCCISCSIRFQPLCINTP